VEKQLESRLVEKDTKGASELYQDLAKKNKYLADKELKEVRVEKNKQMNNFQSKIVEIQAKLDMDEMLANAKISKIEDKFAEKLRKHDEIISDNKAKAESKALKLEEQRREILKQLEDAKQKVYNGKTGSNYFGGK